MRHIRKKIDRVQPLIKVRKAQLDHEAQALAEIRKTKLAALDELRKFQTSYIQGVEELNRLRQAGDISRLLTMESSVDYVKSQWYQSLKMVKHIEEQEKSQLDQVLSAQRQLKSTEALNDRLSIELIAIQRDLEQKEADDISMQRFQRKDKY